MSRRCYVWTTLTGAPRLVGATEVDAGRGVFRYAPQYLEAGGPSIDPINLPLREGEFETTANHGLFGVLADAGPDAWGRRILTHLHPKRMASASPVDVLLLMGSHGIGALQFEASRDRVKPRAHGIALKDLGAAAEAAHQVEMGEVLREQLRQILDAASSIGGMNPKVAVVGEDGGEWIAKFRGREDVVDTPRIELASMHLARDCGIDAAEVRFTALGERSAVLVRRFDRSAEGVLHYASAHALWNRARANEASVMDWASYAGIGALRRQLPGGDIRADLEELFRRLLLNVVIGNTDDHGRNHGFLMDAQGAWRLSPAFDLLPNVGGSDTVQSLGAGPAGRERSLDNVIAGAASFGLSQRRAGEIAADIRETIDARWEGRLDEARVASAERTAVLARRLL